MSFGNTIDNPRYDKLGVDIDGSFGDKRGNLFYLFDDTEAETLRLDNRAAGEKILIGYDPVEDKLQFRFDGGYFGGQNKFTVDSEEDFEDLILLVSEASGVKGGGDSYVTVYEDDLILHMDADNHFRGDTRLILEGHAEAAEEAGVIKVLDFDEFTLEELNSGPDGQNQEEALSLLTEDGEYQGFKMTQVGIFQPKDGAQWGYKPASGPNTAFVGERMGGERPGYEDDVGSGVTITRDEPFTFIGAAFNSTIANYFLQITATAYADDEQVGEKTFWADRFGEQDYVTFSDPDDGQRFESITRLEFDAPPQDWSYFGFDDFTYT